MEQRRYLEAPITADLTEKMVFLAGPRQVGKTTLAKQILAAAGTGICLNWDNREDRREIRAARWPGGSALVILDELHKWRTWKNWIKGEFDKHRDHIQFLITGSARMDIYRRGGDSLQGRYHHYRLHPFSCAEMTRGRQAGTDIVPGEELPVPTRGNREMVAALMRFGGFPEPFLKQSARTLRRWQKERIERFFREDVRDLEYVRDFSSLQIVADLIPERVGAPLSLNALREDLEVSHRAVTHWVEILKRLYYVFSVRPYDTKQARMLRKMPKAYMWDSSLVQDVGPRFENLVALHLLKFCHYLEDREGHTVQLCYLRDRTGREVDFLVTVNHKPWFAVEAKTSDARVAPPLSYFRERLRIPWVYQVVLKGTRDFVQDGVRCLPAHRFFDALI
ncbi:MAG: ATP-binding protein [Candidatus Eisenbacteria sp.]|nr:ATP-binding protein [Candidatus Eisenbacteria bacterium]